MQDKEKTDLSRQFEEFHNQGKYYKNLPKVFVIGHNKTATKAIDCIFKLSNYRAVHWAKGRLAGIIFLNLKSNLPLLTHIDDYHCYSDMEMVGEFYAYELFPLFDLQYPGSLFVYNKRNTEDWIKSRLNHLDYTEQYQARFNSKNFKKLTTIDEVKQHWKDFHARHERRVLKYFEQKNNLIQLDIESLQSQRDFIQRLSKEGFKINDSLKTLPIVGAGQTIIK